MATTAAVADPFPETETQEQANGLKRRHSEELEGEAGSKRQRTSPGKNSPPATRDGAAGDKDTQDTPTEDQHSIPAGGTPRKSSVVDEKQRSKRLFGALLGNLRQPEDRASKRRQEIESRKKAELRKQDDERLEDRQRRQEQLVEQRKVAQVKVDEENMRRRHRMMLDKANFLQTESEPRLFYRPWDLRDNEEDLIDDLVKDAQDVIDKEVSEFNERHGRANDPENSNGTREAEPEGVTPRLEGDDKAQGNDTPEANSGRLEADATTAPSHQGDAGGNVDARKDVDADVPMTDDKRHGKADESPNAGDAEDDGEHVQEGDEDAVIY